MKGELQEAAQNVGMVSTNGNKNSENFAIFIICKKQKYFFFFLTVFLLPVNGHRTNILKYKLTYT